jgi:hypothetical protein
MRFTYLNDAIPLLAVSTEQLFNKILTQTDINGAIITRTKSSSIDQARIMYENIEQFGETAQRKLYKADGQLIIDVYASQKAMGATAVDTIHAMERKILEIGPENVSAHCSNNPEKDIFDVAPSSILDKKKPIFEGCISNTSGVTKFLKPPIDPSYHIETRV